MIDTREMGCLIFLIFHFTKIYYILHKRSEDGNKNAIVFYFFFTVISYGRTNDKKLKTVIMSISREWINRFWHFSQSEILYDGLN